MCSDQTHTYIRKHAVIITIKILQFSHLICHRRLYSTYTVHPLNPENTLYCMRSSSASNTSIKFSPLSFKNKLHANFWLCVHANREFSTRYFRDYDQNESFIFHIIRRRRGTFACKGAVEREINIYLIFRLDKKFII